MNMFVLPAAGRAKISTIYERLAKGGHTARLYYFDQTSSTMEIVMGLIRFGGHLSCEGYDLRTAGRLTQAADPPPVH